MAAFASASDMCKRFDVRLLGDLVGDAGIRVEMDSLIEPHPNLLACLEDASGEISESLIANGRYTEAELLALTGNSLSMLKRICCALAMDNLFARRPWSDDPRRAQACDKAEQARNALESLRTGKTVLTPAAVEAGLPEGRTPALAVVNRLNMTVDTARSGYYMARSMPTG